MALIKVRVDEELKKRMSRFKNVNWSEVARRAILDVLKREEERNLATALLLNERNIIKPEEGFSSVKVIRRWREA